ncbi:zinc knuckle [Cooperia oncophora]
MKAYLVKHLKKRGGVTEFCLELERLSREAYPDASEEELSRTRAGELVSQLTDWPEYLQLFTTMEIAPKEQAYDMVKAMAQRCERSKQVAAAMRNAMEGHARKSQTADYVNHDARQVQTTVNTLEGGSSKLDVRDATAQRRPVGKCFNCNKQGHLRKDCTMPKKNATVTEKPKRSAQQAEPATAQQAKPARIFTASLRKWICGAVEVDNKCELVGEQTTTEVHLLGTSRKALLDTGSQISIIPLQVLQAALESGFDLDADVEEIPLDQQKQVFDASGNRMSFKGAIRLTLQMSDGKKLIRAFVMALVLGTNALRPLGYNLTQRKCSESVALPPITKAKEIIRNVLNSPLAHMTADSDSQRAYEKPWDDKTLIRANDPYHINPYHIWFDLAYLILSNPLSYLIQPTVVPYLIQSNDMIRKCIKGVTSMVDLILGSCVSLKLRKSSKVSVRFFLTR